MMTKDADKKREQMMMFSMDDMVPKDHMLRKIDRAINWNFIYDLVEDKYCADNGRPSMDPVMLIKIPFIQYLYGIRSMRQTIKEIEVNVAYRWFLGLDMLDPVPHFSTFGKNYTRRFKDTGLFEQIFSHILEECMKFHLVDTSTIFVDSTHVKACANSKKMRKRIASQEALWYEEELKKEIINFLSNISSVTEIDEDIISSGVALLDDNQIKGYITYEKFCEYGLIRYFIFQKNLPSSSIIDMFSSLVSRAKTDEIESFISIGKTQEVIDLFNELAFYQIEQDNFLINGQNLKGTELEEAKVLKFDII